MKIRAITGLFFVIVVLASMLVSAYLFVVFFIALSASCLAEFYRIIATESAKPYRMSGVALGLLISASYAGYCLDLVPARALYLTIPTMGLVFIGALYSRREKPFSDIAYTLLGLLYVVLPFTAFMALGFLDRAYDYRIPLGFMLILWGNDTGAYLVGRYLGKHRLFERVSPRKTWEGLFGGILLALATARVLAHYYPVLPSWQWLGIALTISLFGTFGDLVESLLKRSHQVKDSGALLPGHGGLLDRFDGLLLAAPAVLAFLKLVLP